MLNSNHTSSKSNFKHVPLVSWIWRSYFRTSLIPLLIVEVALISLYFISNAISNRENIEAVRTLAEQEVTQTALREATGINHQLEGITRATEFLRQQTTKVMHGQEALKIDDPSRFAYSKDGAFYTTKNNGGSALFYSGVMPIGKKEREKAYRSAGLDGPYIGIKDSFPLIVQLYYNTYDSLNRIYPYFEVLTQYPAKMDIPSYNFYYEADLKHNPEKKVVWTDVYVDPAGQGWMTSAIAPVYSGKFLEGVVGVDVTVGTIIRDVLDLKIPWDGYGLLVSRTGTIIALPKAGEGDWGLQEFTTHQYSEAIQKDTFKPADFNLFERNKNTKLSKALREQGNGMMHAELNGKRIVSWATIPETGWKLLITVPENKVYATSQSLASRLNTLAWIMVGGMLVFYVIFFSILFRRAKQMSEFISQPLEHIDNMVKSVASGQYKQQPPDFPVDELSRTAHGIVQMGMQLDDASQSRELAEQALVQLTRQLQSIFDLSPDGFISIDDSTEIVLVNPAFCRMTGTEAKDWLGLHEDALWKKLSQLTQLPILASEQQQSFRLELLRPSRKVLQCAIRSVRHEDASLAGKVIYLHDMTREDELDRMKSQFLSTAAHELRTPLTSVMGYSELLLNQMVPAEMQTVALNSIVKQSKWLVQIINELLDLTTIEGNGMMDFNIESYPADLLAIEALNKFEVPANRTPLFCSTLADLYVNVDAEKFRPVLLNILDNAYKFSEDGDVSMLIVEDNIDGIAKVGFRIEDNGIGMTEEQIKLVFDRFWRADDTGSVPGTGLGMSISHEIVKLLGGNIEIKSTFGKGTSVTVWLPKANVEKVAE